MAHTTSPHRRGGRPPRGVDRRQWNPRVSPAMSTALANRATRSGVQAATYREILISLAHSFSSDRMDQIAVPLTMAPSTGDDLVRLVRQISPSDFALPEKGLSVRLPIKLDEPLAVEIEGIAESLGVDVSKYLRAIFRIAIGQDAEVIGTQDKLDFTAQDAQEEVRLAS